MRVFIHIILTAFYQNIKVNSKGNFICHIALKSFLAMGSSEVYLKT